MPVPRFRGAFASHHPVTTRVGSDVASRSFEVRREEQFLGRFSRRAHAAADFPGDCSCPASPTLSTRKNKRSSAPARPWAATHGARSRSSPSSGRSRSRRRWGRGVRRRARLVELGDGLGEDVRVPERDLERRVARELHDRREVDAPHEAVRAERVAADLPLIGQQARVLERAQHGVLDLVLLPGVAVVGGPDPRATTGGRGAQHSRVAEVVLSSPTYHRTTSYLLEPLGDQPTVTAFARCNSAAC